MHGPKVLELIGPIIAEHLDATYNGLQKPMTAFDTHKMVLTCNRTGSTIIAASKNEALEKMALMRNEFAKAAK
jgi:hypothetical protein